MQTVRALPRARVDRLTLRFAALSLLAFACVGAAIHLLIVRGMTSGDRMRLDLALGGGLLGLYALVLPLALRTGRTMREQAVRLQEKSRQLSALRSPRVWPESRFSPGLRDRDAASTAKVSILDFISAGAILRLSPTAAITTSRLLARSSSTGRRTRRKGWTARRSGPLHFAR